MKGQGLRHDWRPGAGEEAVVVAAAVAAAQTVPLGILASQPGKLLSYWPVRDCVSKSRVDWRAPEE